MRLPLAAVLIALSGCAATATTPPNGSFTATPAEAKLALSEMRRDPKPLDRPLVVLGGFMDFGVGPAMYVRRLAPHVDGRCVTVVYPTATSFDETRRRTVAAVDRAFGRGTDPDQTVEVDVVGQSMGGLVAMHAALRDPTLGRRLNVRRLYTISSPLQGAKLAQRAGYLAPLHRDMRPGSRLYRRLASEPIDYELVSYTRLDDRTVGERFAAAAGRGVYWLANPPGQVAHWGAFRDDLILADLVRRLRREPPLTTETPLPLPAGSSGEKSAVGL